MTFNPFETEHGCKVISEREKKAWLAFNTNQSISQSKHMILSHVFC
jgi:hypothetical protein